MRRLVTRPIHVTGQTRHRVPGVYRPLLPLGIIAGIDHITSAKGRVEPIPVLLVDTEIGGGKRVVRTLGDVVQTPIHAVDVHVRVHAVRRRLPHGQLRAAVEFVTRILRLACRISPLPAVVGFHAESQRFELVHRALAKQWVFQTARTVIVLEQQPERVLLGQPVPSKRTALNTDARVQLKSLVAIGMNQLDRGGPLVVRPAAGRACVNAR